MYSCPLSQWGVVLHMQISAGDFGFFIDVGVCPILSFLGPVPWEVIYFFIYAKRF